MSGRAEHEEQVNQKIENLIYGYPEYLEEFNISMEAGGLTHNSRLIYMKSVVAYLNYLRDDGMDIYDKSIFTNINSMQIKKYFMDSKYKKNGEEKSGSYTNVQENALSFFFRFLVENEVIDKNPLRIDGQSIRIGKHQDAHTQVTLDPYETNMMYQNIENGVGSHRAQAKQAKWRERDLALIDLALNTGLRVSALTEINIDDIDFDAHTINVIEKGDKAFTVFFDEQCEKLLKNWIKKRKKLLGEAKTDALFISNQRQRISQNCVRQIVKKYSTGINKRISSHKLRSSFGTAIMVETLNEHIVQTALGHSGTVTDRYLNNKDEEKKIAIKAARQYYNRGKENQTQSEQINFIEGCAEIKSESELDARLNKELN